MAEKVFGRPASLVDVPTHYCPGCHHGIIHRLVAEVIDELGVQDSAIGVAPERHASGLATRHRRGT